MLQQQQRVFDAAGLAQSLQGALEIEGRAVCDPAKIEDVSDHHDVFRQYRLTLDDGNTPIRYNRPQFGNSSSGLAVLS